MDRSPNLFLIALSLVSGSALASNGVSSWTFSGFGTLGYSYENEENISFLRDYSQRLDDQKNHSFISDSQLGGQISYRSSPYWDATVQLVAANVMEWEPKNGLEWAYLAFHPTANFDVRIGRVGLDLFAISDTRRVDYAHIWLRPPAEVYSWVPAYSIDGADMTYSFIHGDTFYRAKLQYGVSESTVGIANSGTTYDFRGEQLTTLSLSAEYMDWKFRVTGARVVIASSIPRSDELIDHLTDPRLAAQFDMVGNDLHYLQAGMAYDNLNWLVLSELTYSESQSELMPNGYAGYLTVGKRINNWTPFITYSFFDAKDSPWTVGQGASELEYVAAELINSGRIDQSTITLGARWDFSSNTALTLQWDRSQLASFGSSLWSGQGEGLDRQQTIDLFSVSVAFIF